jgi:ANTAR domain
VLPRITDTLSTDSRFLDVAKGVLVALRGYSPEEAFTELTGISQRFRLGTLALARALVQLAEGSAGVASGPATEAAIQTWGHLFPTRAGAHPA